MFLYSTIKCCQDATLLEIYLIYCKENMSPCCGDCFLAAFASSLSSASFLLRASKHHKTWVCQTHTLSLSKTHNLSHTRKHTPKPDKPMHSNQQLLTQHISEDLKEAVYTFCANEISKSICPIYPFVFCYSKLRTHINTPSYIQYIYPHTTRQPDRQSETESAVLNHYVFSCREAESWYPPINSSSVDSL